MFALSRRKCANRASCSWRRLVASSIASFLAATAFLVPVSAKAVSDVADAHLLDEAIGKYVSADGAPGGAAVVVRSDGRITLRGYGVTDVATKRSVDPESTVFRIGSISKTFTAIAVLQLVDEGKVDLQDDANRYLKGVQIPVRGYPVRVVDLLTHRAGFDGDLTFVGLDDPVAAASSSALRLQRDIYQVRDAGRVASYDNMAWGLLGQIVESVDGVPYAQAIAKRIFAPLAMKNSAVGLPTDLSTVATAYEVGSDGKPHPKPQIYLRRGWQGAGDLSTTAADMSRFLLAMLNKGIYPGGRLLTEETFRRHTDTSQFRLNPGLGGTGLGVYGLGQLDGGAFGHGGTIRGFNATFIVIPKQEFALFAVMNLNRPAPEMSLKGLADYIANPPGKTNFDPTDYMTIDLPYELDRRLQGAKPTSNQKLADEAVDSDWSGRYSGLRMESYEALLPKLAVALLLSPKVVHVDERNNLFVNSTGPYHRIGTGLYSLDEPEGPLKTTLGFSQVGSDVFMGPHTLQASRRLAWYERPLLTIGGLLFAPLILIVAALLGRGKDDPSQRLVNRAQLLSACLFLVGVGAELTIASRMSRVEDLGWLVFTWRMGMAVTLLAMAAAAIYFGLRTFISAERRGIQGSCQTHARATATIIGAAWACFAAVYWNVPFHFF